MAALMIGIDFSKTDVQISLWNEEKTCAEIYQFSDNSDALIGMETYNKIEKEGFAVYLKEVLSLIRNRYAGASIAKIGITGERMTERKKEQLTTLMQSIGYEKEQLFFSTHADAVLWYEVYGGASKGASMTLDFDGQGMLAYFVQLGNEILKRPYYVETIDYSNSMQGSLDVILEEKEQQRQFAELLERAISKKQLLDCM